MANTGELEVDMLFLGLTRPPMLWGVTYSIVMVYFLVCMFGFVLTSNFLCFLAMPIVHGIAYIALQKEPLALDLWIARNSKCNKCKNKFYHGMTNSYDVM